MKKLAIGLVLSLLCCSFTAYAADVCAKLPGTWIGHGKVDFNSLASHCVYNGIFDITSNDPNAGTFSSNVTLLLLEGICPAKVKIKLPGTCKNGTVSIVTSDGSVSLSGQLNQNGKVGKLDGDIFFRLKDQTIHGLLSNATLIKFS